MKIKSLPDDKITFKGKVIVTDPCYVFGDVENDFWSDFCGVLWEDSGNKVFQVDCTKIFVLGTNSGDGEYPVLDKDENIVGRCGVDAGLLSIIPLNFAKKLGFKRWDLVTVIEGGETFDLGVGNFQCGDYKILTDGEWEQEQEEKEEEELRLERERKEEENNEEE